MLKNYINKQTIIAFSVGALLFSATPIKAATDYITAYFNNYQKVTVNGTEKQIQFLNANDTNYGKLRDIVNALGGNTNYNDSTQTIEITTATPSVSTSANKNTGVNNMSTPTIPVPTPQPISYNANITFTRGPDIDVIKLTFDRPIEDIINTKLKMTPINEGMELQYGIQKNNPEVYLMLAPGKYHLSPNIYTITMTVIDFNGLESSKVLGTFEVK